MRSISRTLLIGALAFTSNFAHADPPTYKFHSISIRTKDGEIKGYTSLPAKLELRESDWLEDLKASGHSQIWFWDKLVLIKYPFEMLASVGKVSKWIDLASIRSVKPIPGEFAGRTISGLGVPEMSISRARVLQKQPIHFCAPQYVEKGLYWFSYNKAVGKERLEGICTRTFDAPPGEKEIQTLERYPGVFQFYYNVD